MSSPQPDSPAYVELRIHVVRVAWTILFVCLFAELVFVILDYHVSYGRATDIGALRRMFNTAREDGLASWFAVTQTFLIALTLWLTYALAKNGDQSRAKVLGWLVLACFFTYMTRARFGKSDFDTLRHFSKSIEEAIEMAANSLFWFIFLRHLPSVSKEFRVRLFGATGATQ